MLWLLLILPLAGAFLALPAGTGSGGRARAAWALGLPAAAALALVLSAAPTVLAGTTRSVTLAWMPELGLDLSLHLDGLAWLFALLVFGIGTLIVLYAGYYLADSDPPGRFFCFLGLFMASMAGVVLSANLLVLAVAWELTSLSSFLLIGYWSHRADARRGAGMALAITGLGGLALLAGMVLLGQIAGSYDLENVLATGSALAADPRFDVAVALILLGAFTKSAQFPFHVWLPRAMAAPTPVSAYLHSATMVKAGVFLLARLWPVLMLSEVWERWVPIVGALTLVVGAWGALVASDLKGLLAYSTISHLGLVTTLFGLGTPMAATVAVFHIMNHAAFKAALFMLAGIVDHETGTRDLARLSGLRRAMPVSFALTALAAAAMAGLPPLSGFLSKEMFFTEVIAHAGASSALALAALIAGLLGVAYSLRLAAIFWGEPSRTLPKPPHEPPWPMRLPAELLTGIALAVGLIPALALPLLEAAARATVREPLPPFSLSLWHGFNLPLLMSAVAIAVGFATWRLIPGTRLERLGGRTFERLWGLVLDAATSLARAITGAIDTGSTQRTLLLVVVVTLALGATPLLEDAIAAGPLATPIDPLAATLVVMLVISAGVATWLHRSRYVALLWASVVGLAVSLLFVRLEAPDLALTQLLVEVVSILLFLIALSWLPTKAPREPRGRRVRDIGIALISGAAVALLTFAITSRESRSISDYFLAQSKPAGGGTNVVNVILVDFRGFDTLGEITVLCLAAVGVAVLLHGVVWPSAVRSRESHDPFPLILRVVSRALLPLAMVFAIYLMLRGHNQPGGGFIAGLMFAVALVLQRMASGATWTAKRLRPPAQGMMIAGVGVALATGLASWWFGYPLLTSAFRYVDFPVIGKLEVASALGFDLGVFLVVVGSTRLLLTRLTDERATLSIEPPAPRESDPWKA
jgi:multicomponent K+:H+ antiporter subunit A